MAFGHTLAGVRVQRVHKVQRVQRVVVAAVAANNKGARLRRRLCSRVVFASLRGREKVLKIDRPWAGGFLSLTALGAEGWGGLWTRLGRREGSEGSEGSKGSEGSEGCGSGCCRKFIGRLSAGSFEVCVIFDIYHFGDWPPAAATPLSRFAGLPPIQGAEWGLSVLSLRDMCGTLSSAHSPNAKRVASVGTTTRRILQLTNSPSFSGGPLFYRGRRSTVLRRRDC